MSRTEDHEEMRDLCKLIKRQIGTSHPQGLHEILEWAKELARIAARDLEKIEATGLSLEDKGEAFADRVAKVRAARQALGDHGGDK